MPLGGRLDLSGLLLRDGDRLTLRIAGGGEWIIDPPLFARTRQLVGQRVRVVGTRGGFNLVNADDIDLA